MPDPHPLPIVADLLREHGMDEAAERLLARCETCRWWNRRYPKQQQRSCERIVTRVPHSIVAFRSALHDGSQWHLHAR